MDRTLLKIFSFLASLAIYLLIALLFVTFFFTKTVPKKIQIQADAIDVMIVEEKKPKVKKTILTQKSQRKIVSKPKKRVGSASPKKRANIKNLFASLDTKALQTKLPHKKRSENPSRYRGEGGKKARKLLEKLKLQDFEPAPHKSIKSVQGEKDPYLQKVYKILYSYWIPSKESAGAEAKVRITIDENGELSYEILQLSNNETFNEELKNYLDAMRLQQFPKPEKKRVFDVLFVAKD